MTTTTSKVDEPKMTEKEIAFIKDLESALLEARAIREGKIKNTPLKDSIEK